MTNSLESNLIIAGGAKTVYDAQESPSDILDVKVELSNFEGRYRVSVREFLGYASMALAENNYRKGVEDTNHERI